MKGWSSWFSLTSAKHTRRVWLAWRSFKTSTRPLDHQKFKSQIHCKMLSSWNGYRKPCKPFHSYQSIERSWCLWQRGFSNILKQFQAQMIWTLLNTCELKPPYFKQSHSCNASTIRLKSAHRSKESSSCMIVSQMTWFCRVASWRLWLQWVVSRALKATSRHLSWSKFWSGRAKLMPRWNRSTGTPSTKRSLTSSKRLSAVTSWPRSSLIGSFIPT